MCGIAGLLAFDGSPIRATEGIVTAMRECVRHRGPNGGETWIDERGTIGLGHRRLSIIDLAPEASQPMANEDGSIRIVFNGEIYNHRELRAELSKSGRHKWSTDHSDTEAIIHGFEEWGIDVVSRLRGMFAFALWDARNHALWLVRDRIGIKPLYFSIDQQRISFASEIKALLEVPGQRRAVHEEALFHYLSFLTTPGTQTLFDGINKMAPGSWMRIGSDGQVKTERYWDVWRHARPIAAGSDEELAERILGELRTSVQLRKLSDVPVGVFLSGGLDSSTNAALFSEGEGRPVRTYSIGYDRDYQGYANELHFAKAMAERIGSEHHERRLTRDDVVDFLPKMIHLQDEPIADPVCVPVYYVADLARQDGTVVCQLGEGADEMFIGYPNWLQALERQQYADLPVPAVVAGVGASMLRAGGYDHAWQDEYLRRASRNEPLFWGGAESFADSEKRKLLSPRLRAAFKDTTSWDALAPIRKDFLDNAHETSNLNWMSYVDLRLRLPELLLMRVDKMTMGVGLEARVPFLDHEFVTLAMSIPANRKAPNGRLKHLLKTAVRGLVPDELIDRKKQGFGVPVDDLFAGRLADVATREITRFCDATDLIDRDAALNLIKTGQGSKTWYLLNLAMWWRKFIAGEDQRHMTLTVLRHGSGRWEEGAETIVSVDRLKAALANGTLFSHLFRYSEARILTHRLETIGRPLKLAIFLRLLSRGGCFVDDESGRRRALSLPLIVRWTSQALMEPFTKGELLKSIKKEAAAISAAARASKPRRLDLSKPPVYLRTDLSFGLKAGGSVGHTAGVINNLRAFAAPPIMLTTDIVPTVDPSIPVQTVAPAEAFWEYPELPSLVMNARFAEEIAAMVGAHPISFVYQRYSLNNFSGAKMALDRGVPFVLEYNGSEIWMSRNWGTPLEHEKLSEKIEFANFEAADLIVVVSQPMADELIGRGIPAAKILVNPNGVDPEKYSPGIDGSEIRRKYGLEKSIVIGFIGTFGPWHGAEVLARAFGRLLTEHPAYRESVRLLMIGDGVKMPEVVSAIDAANVGKLTVLTGIVPQADGPKYLAACDILASPHVPNADGTPFFGSPTKLFEYMAMGRAIVASDLDQVGEILEHGKAAQMAVPGSVDSLVSGLRALVDDPARRDELAKEARRLAVERHSWHEHTKRIVDALSARVPRA